MVVFRSSRLYDDLHLCLSDCFRPINAKLFNFCTYGLDSVEMDIWINNPMHILDIEQDRNIGTDFCT